MGQGSFSFDGHRVSFEAHGSGPRVVVLLHGLLLDASVNRRLARSLAAHGYRVVLLDLLGHGLSDKPRHASVHRMDIYKDQVLALLDELAVERAVIGGVSLGADVALQMAVAAPERIEALIIEMPVLERAAPAAAMAFVPMLLGIHYLRRFLRVPTSLVSRIPRTGIDLLDAGVAVLSVHPDEAAAVLHGVLLGPIAPTIQQRATIEAPTLVIGHRHDLVHPFSDADNLTRQLPNAELLTAQSMAELRISPRRLTTAILAFLDGVYLDEVGPVTRLRSRSNSSSSS